MYVGALRREAGGCQKSEERYPQCGKVRRNWYQNRFAWSVPINKYGRLSRSGVKKKMNR